VIELSVNESSVKEIEEAQKDITRKLKEMTGPPVVTTMRNATLMVLRDAKIFAPVDTGRLRASITPSVSGSADRVEGVVGSNVKYAPYQETGTWPVKPSGQGPRYLQRSFEKNVDRIMDMFERVIKKITES
jgi:phage gpG-like protein